MATIEPPADDPASRYASPQELCDDDALSEERKCALLRQWEYDLRTMQVASDENMTNTASHPVGESADLLTEVRECLRRLGDAPDKETASPNKQGAASLE